MKAAEVNYNAEGTWLEPYVGHDLKVKGSSKHQLCIIMDYGDKNEAYWVNKRYFDLNTEIILP